MGLLVLLQAQERDYLCVLCYLSLPCEEPRINTAVTRSSYHTPVKQMFMLLTECRYESVFLVPSRPLTGHSLHASYSVPTG